MKTSQTVAGVAALTLGCVFSVLIGVLVVVAGQGYTPGSGNNSASALAFAASSPLPYFIYLLYMVYALAFVLVSMGLYDRLGADAPRRMQLSVVAGVVAGALFLVYAMLGFVGEPTLVQAYQTDAAVGAAAYLGVRVVSNGLNTAAIFAAGWCVLLAGWAALTTGALPKGLAGLLILAGLLSTLAFVVPIFSLLAPLLYIMWSLWLGFSWLRQPVQRAIAV